MSRNIAIRSLGRQSALAQPPAESIRSSFKSTQFSSLQKNTLSKQQHPLKCTTPFLNIEKKDKINFKTIEQGCKPPSAYSRVKKGKSFGGMNEHFMCLRKENHLNSAFNIRKNKLKEITKANRQIYIKLNSQKSVYSSIDLNKSYQSIKVIKERLSQSKLSHRSSLSRQSSRKSLNNTKSLQGLRKKEAVPFEVKVQNIAQADMKDLDKFKILFQKDTNIRSKQATHNGKGLFKQNSFRNTETYMKEMRALGRVSVQSTKEVKIVKR